MRKHIVVTFSLLTALSANAFASDALASDSLVVNIEEVQVNALQPNKQAVSATPLRVVDRQTMVATGVSDVSEALRRMAGVTIRDYGGAGGLKTVSVRGFGSSHTGVLYDGVALGDIRNGQIDLSRYSIDNVSSLSLAVGDNEEIFIPARVAASAATVAITTLPSNTDVFSLETKIKTGSFGLINPFIRVASPISQNLAISIVGDFLHADNNYPFILVNGRESSREKRRNSRIDSGNADFNILWRFKSSSLNFKAYWYGASQRLPGPVIYYNNSNNERLREQNAFAQARLTSRLSSHLSLKTFAKFNFAQSFYSDRSGKYPGGLLSQKYWQREYYASASLLYISEDGSRAYDYAIDWFNNALNSNLPTDSRPFRNSILQALSARLRFSNLTLSARLLYSLYINGANRGEHAADASRLSPSLCLSWRPFSSQLLYLRASYKNIFRVPTFNEAYFDHYGSKDVRPESTDQLNLGLTYTIPASLPIIATLTADAYYNRVRDMIVAVPYNMFVWSVVNLGKVDIFGLDITADASSNFSPRHKINLGLNYAFQRAMPLTNPQASDWKKQVAYIPRHSGSITLSYENPWANISLTGYGVSDRFTTNNNLPATRIDGYFEVGASLWRSFDIKKINLRAQIDCLNLFDKQYCVVANYPMPGRRFVASLTLKF